MQTSTPPRSDLAVFHFGDCRLDTALFRLERAGVAVPVQPRVFDVLRYLVEHRDRVVPSSELLAKLWPGVTVRDGAVPWSISRARRAIGQKQPNHAPIRSVRGVGYQFAGEVRVERRDDAAPVAVVVPVPAELAARVRGILAQGNTGTSESVARLLGIPARALRERLFAEGVSFTSLADAARKRHALLLLDSPHLNVEDVAACVGYAHVQNFARAFRRWTGESPLAYRHGQRPFAPSAGSSSVTNAPVMVLPPRGMPGDANRCDSISIFAKTPK